jgi:imidazolonepropionase-like amidohydrolase
MLISARRLFDGRSPSAVTDPVVEVDEGRIVDIRTSRSGNTAGTLDFGDATILPGLIDVHQHLAFDASTDPVTHLRQDNDATLILRMRAAAQRALAVGVTSIRDLGDRKYLSLDLRDWFAAGHEVGPRIVAAGPPITVTGGHCWFLGGEADGVDGIRKAVRERAARGVDVIKIMVTGGNMTPTVGPHESQYAAEEIRAAVEEAHAHGLRLAAHAHGGKGITDSMRAGADSIEHCTFFSADGVDADPQILNELARSQAIICMTGGTLPGHAPPFPAVRERLERIIANHTSLYRAGARMAVGTDAGVAPNKPHDVLPHGVTGLVQLLGMTNAEALTTVTAVAAEVCGITDHTGSLQVGKDADLLIVAGDPVEDITAIHNVLAVFARGRSANVSSAHQVL